ncbi:MAG: sigma-54-dependent transcriptional regulator [Neptuniibacter sp.]
MHKTISVLMIDDERNLVHSLGFSLKDEQIEVMGAFTGEEGIQKASSESPDVVLLDLGLPDCSGLDLLPQLKNINPNLPIIMISAHGDTRAAVKAVKEGAIDYVTKPFDLDELILLIRRSADQAKLLQELHFLRELNTSTRHLVGSSSVMEKLRNVLDQVGRSSGKTVLITGPSGTGKALIARALHDTRFDDAPFIEINCATLPEQLIEAELFGAERGAYTGANQRRTGLIDLADGGTLFLDEIGELPLHLQAKLLSFLESRSYRPIGGGRERHAEVFVIAATNRALKNEVELGNFREDLFYRLNVLPLEAPTLNSRKEDVPMLVQHFSHRFARQEGGEVTNWDSDTVQWLMNYRWPGNVRELKNLVERLSILYPGESIRPEMLPEEFRSNAIEDTSAEKNYAVAVEDRERQLILDALKETGGRKGLAAEKLGISRHALKRRIQRLQLEESL